VGDHESGRSLPLQCLRYLLASVRGARWPAAHVCQRGLDRDVEASKWIARPVLIVPASIRLPHCPLALAPTDARIVPRR